MKHGIFNCSFVNINNIRAFDEILFLLSLGTGVGFSVERQSIAELPVVSETFYNTDTTINVADSRIGWAKALRELIGLLYLGQIPKIDYSLIRPAGARLKTFGGRASGPEPLKDLFNFCIRVFQNSAGRKLTSIECHDIVCKIGEIIVTGGVRRSALISLSNLSDDRMRDAKTGQWWLSNSQRALANNSAVYTEKPEIGIFMKEWLSLYESKSGERGIFNRLAAKKQVEKIDRIFQPTMGLNPCVSGDTIINTSIGNITIKELTEQFNNGEKNIEVLSFNINNEIVESKLITNAMKTRKNAELIEITIETENNTTKTLKLTPDHKVFTENRGYIRADSLTDEDIIILKE